MKCHHCKGLCIKKGKQKNGMQKYQCKYCKKYQQEEYLRNGWQTGISGKIKTLLKEGCGVRSIGRILQVSCTTVIKRILLIAAKIVKPLTSMGKVYELDELRTYVGKKTRERWIIYAIRSDTRIVTDFRIGRRVKTTLGNVIKTLTLSKARKIYTDGLRLYRYLIPSKIHRKRAYQINHIERMNLSLRTHLKRLSRKTICYSKSVAMLEACTRIYFWG